MRPAYLTLVACKQHAGLGVVAKQYTTYLLSNDPKLLGNKRTNVDVKYKSYKNIQTLNIS